MKKATAIEKINACIAARDAARLELEKIAGNDIKGDVIKVFLEPWQVYNIRELIHNGITYKHSGKMAGISSYSTATMINSFCENMRKKDGCICSKCYADTLLQLRPTLALKAAKNTGIISSYVLPIACFPYLNYQYFRFNAFGELNNYIECYNYYKWAIKNPHCTFALWTKRLDIVAYVDTLQVRPENLNIVYSNPHIDTPEQIREKMRYLKSHFIDNLHAVFSVYTHPGENQNCPKKCIDCLKCYRAHIPGAAPLDIIEKLK